MSKSTLNLESLERLLIAPDSDSEVEALLACYRETVPGRHFSAIILDQESGTHRTFIEGEGWLGPEHPFACAARGEFGVHPAVKSLGATAGPMLLTRSRLLSDTLWKKSEFYNQTDRRYGVEDTATLFLPDGGKNAVFITCAREKKFPNKDLEAAQSLLRVLSLMWPFRKAKRNTQKDTLPPQILTQREHEVLHWVREGKRNSEIAVILGISPHTVHHHLEKIFAKLRVETRAAAARFI